MRDTIAAQFVCHDLPGLASMTSKQSPEETLGGSTIPLCLQIYINYISILIYCPPEIVLLPVYLHKDFIDIERVTITSVVSLETASIDGAKLDAS